MMRSCPALDLELPEQVDEDALRLPLALVDARGVVLPHEFSVAIPDDNLTADRRAVRLLRCQRANVAVVLRAVLGFAAF